MARVNKTTAIAAVMAATSREPTIFTTGFTCRIAQGIEDRSSHFYMTGSMGLAASVGIGVAQWTRRTTVVVDGDGSLLMNPVGLITAGALPDLPLVHIVLDDGCYASTGGQSVPSRRTDLCALATACGYQRVSSTTDVDTFADLVRSTIAQCSFPVLLIARLTAPDAPVPRRIDVHLPAHARRFGLHLSATSKVQAIPQG